ncbi:MAG: rod shape-determining protein MreC [Synergistaceae bacterium]|nr:rod shape-determining protein MreC [Synergistaceae bacterium]
MDNFTQPRNTTREWVHGLTALILGLFLLGVSSGLGVMKSIVDIWGSLLSIPEYPAVIMREMYLGWRSNSIGRDKLNEELARLRNENAKLRMENARLGGGAGLLSEDTGGRRARVTLRAPMSWWSEIRIDRGEQDNVVQGMPVFSRGWLVGRVSSVSPMSSWAELITSASLMIPAVIEETRELGVVAGDGTGAVLLRYIPVGRGVRAGMKVSTAMVGEQLPPGLPIGQIAGEYTSGADGYSTYRIEPGADMSGFYTVSY